jgi:hypothetical protein
LEVVGQVYAVGLGHVKSGTRAREIERAYGENAPGEGIDCEAARYADPAVASIRR